MALGVIDAGANARAVPVADGGDGTLDVLLAAAGGGVITVHRVAGPLGTPAQARLGWLDKRTAVVELAEASGLRLLRGRGLAALVATTRGTGELVALAIDAGAERVIVGVGGSASTDGGAGLLRALGTRLVDGGGREIDEGGAALERLERIELDAVRVRLRGARVQVAVDVANPLLGPDGAASVFAPQKGASPADVAVLEGGLARFAAIAERDLDAVGLAATPGTGAAGGAAYGLALAGASLLPGAPLICDEVRLDAALQGAALVLTGEGRLDSQTAAGKAPDEVAKRARAAGVPCVAIAGSVVDPLGGIFTETMSLTELAGDLDPRQHAGVLLRRAAYAAVERFAAS